MKTAYIVMLSLNRRLNKAQFKAEYTRIRVYVKEYNAPALDMDDSYYEENSTK